MNAERQPSALDRLAPAATAPERLRVRVRLGVGGAIVLVLAALIITVLISAFGQQTSSSIGPAGAAASESPTPFGSADSPAGAAGEPNSADTATLFVHVLGAVASPGVVELSDGSRVLDAIAAAGGLTATADPSGANLARRVTDGEQIYLPQQGELPAGAPPGTVSGQAGAGSATGAGSTAGTIVDLNAATLAELETLPRIGPAMAQRIVDYRTSNGPFSTIDDLRNVTGIGDKTFDALRELVRV
ncbi:MAG: helix-hairpin-helix domain-containing protein [Cryobacterium sp.]